MDVNVTDVNVTITGVTLRCLRGYRQIPYFHPYLYLRFILFVPVMFVIVPIGVVGNSLAFMIIGRERPFTSTSILLRALAVADSLVLLAGFFYENLRWFHNHVILINTYMEFWNLARGYNDAFLWFVKMASIYLTVCVALERFIAVCKPLKAALMCTKKRAYITVGYVFGGSLFYRIPRIFMFTVVYEYDQCIGRGRPVFKHYRPVYDHPAYYIFYYKILESLICAVLPIIILLVVTGLVMRVLKSSKTKYADLAVSAGNRNKGADLATVRVITVVIIFLILETPAALYDIIRIFERFTSLHVDVYSNIFLYFSSDFLSFANCFVNFFIYCASGRKFRTGVTALLSSAAKMHSIY